MARTRRRRSYRKSKRWNPGCMNPRRRNPSGGELPDGTVVSVAGNFVTLHGPYGESYDYESVDHHTLARLRKAQTFSKACRMLDKHCVLRHINPKRGGGRKKGRRKAHPATRKGRHHASRLRSEWKRRTRYARGGPKPHAAGKYPYLSAVVRTDKHGRIHAGRKKHVKGHSWTGRKGTVALYDRRSGKLWGTNPRRRGRHRRSRNDKTVAAYARTHHHAQRKGGKARRRARKWYNIALRH